MSPSVVQSITASSNTTSGTLGTPAVAGNTLLLCVFTQNGSSATNAVTCGSMTSIDAKNGSSGSSRGGVAAFRLKATGGETSVSFSVSGPNTADSILIEISGLDTTASPVDITFPGATLNNVSGSQNAGAGTTANANDYIICVVGGRDTSVMTVTWGGGLTSLVSVSSGNAKGEVAALAVSSAGSYTPGLSLSSAVVGGVIAVAFKQAGAATISGTASASLGGFSASSTGTRTTSGTVTASFGGFTATASGVRTTPATASASLGGFDGQAATTPQVDGTAAASLGGFTAAAVGASFRIGTATANLGGFLATVSGDVIAVLASTGDAVIAWDTSLDAPAVEYRALLEPPGSDASDEALDVGIRHALVPYLPEGIRDPGTGESVVIQQEGDDWTIVDVKGKRPRAGGNFIPAIEADALFGCSDRTGFDGSSIYTAPFDVDLGGTIATPGIPLMDPDLFEFDPVAPGVKLLQSGYYSIAANFLIFDAAAGDIYRLNGGWGSLTPLGMLGTYGIAGLYSGFYQIPISGSTEPFYVAAGTTFGVAIIPVTTGGATPSLDAAFLHIIKYAG